MKTTEKLLAEAVWPRPGHYVVAVDSDASSVVLLHLLASLPATSWRFRLAGFVDDNRPDSLVDRQLLMGWSRIHGWPLDLMAAPAADSLQQLRRRQSAAGIITPDHLDHDQANSLANFLQPDAVVSGKGKLVDGIYKPLIKVPRQDLLDYARHYGLPWRNHWSSDELADAPTFLRRELVPAARDGLADFDQRYQDQAATKQTLDRQINSQLSKLLKTHSQLTETGIKLPRDWLVGLSNAALERLLHTVVHRLQPDLTLSPQAIHDLAILTKTAPAGTTKVLSPQLAAGFDRDKVVISLGGSQSTEPQTLQPGTSIRFNGRQLSMGHLGRHLPGAVLARVPELTVRAYDPADQVHLPSGRQNLTDILQAAGVPPSLWLTYPVATSYNNEVVWVPQLALAANYWASSDDPAAHALTHEVLLDL